MYRFTEDCLTGISQIDEEHRRLFEMINQALALLQSSEDVSVIVRKLIPDMKEYAATHFAHEEAYMEEIDDPELSMQKKEHAAFAEKVNCMVEENVTRQEAEEFLTFLVRWLYHHILSNDMMIGQMVRLEESVRQEENPFAFTAQYHIGIPFIDEEHARLFEIIEEVYEVSSREAVHDKYDEIVHLLDELKDYTVFHFGDEEKYMESIHYAGLEAQKRAHAAFINKLDNIDLDRLSVSSEEQEEYLVELLEYLLGWLRQHILKADKLIGQ